MVLLDHFIHWQDVIPRADTSASTVATALDAQIRCCFGLLEQIHSDQVMQFQLQLIAKLASLWLVEKTHITPHHPQSKWSSW